MAGRDYPRTYREFVEMFPDDPACARYLEALRWPTGFACLKCGAAAEPWRQTRGRLLCRSCRRHTTVTSGTIFDKTRTPLTTWFETAWHVTTAKNGMSAKTLERTLGIRYRVAWTMLQRFRVAMVRSERESLAGVVEVDETLVGGIERGGKRGRGTSKAVVVVAVEILDPKGFGRLRMRHIADASGANLVPFVCDVVATGSVVHTDVRVASPASGDVVLPEMRAEVPGEEHPLLSESEVQEVAQDAAVSDRAGEGRLGRKLTPTVAHKAPEFSTHGFQPGPEQAR